MPGFLIFEEFGKAMEAVDTMTKSLSPLQKAAAKKAARAALLRTPGAWMTHGVIGEEGVDVDPIAAMNKLANGELSVDLGLKPYRGWIPLNSVSQSVQSTAEHDKRRLREAINASNQKALGPPASQPGETAQSVTGPAAPSAGPSQGSALPGSVVPERSGPIKTGMSGSTGGVNTITAEVEVDASFPKLLKMVLQSSATEGRKIRSSADIHLCTHAAIDMSQVTLGNNSPAAKMIQTLLSLGFADIVPYLSIHMDEVTVTDIDFSLDGDTASSIPTVNVTLEFEAIKWTYHVINGSNMNLFDVDYEYQIKDREQEAGPGGMLGKLASAKAKLNPFA